MRLLALLLLVPALAAGQSLVLVGGNLNNNNLVIWEKMIELAVSLQKNKR